MRVSDVRTPAGLGFDEARICREIEIPPKSESGSLFEVSSFDVFGSPLRVSDVGTPACLRVRTFCCLRMFHFVASKPLRVSDVRIPARLGVRIFCCQSMFHFVASNFDKPPIFTGVIRG